MGQFIINGPNKLEGTVKISGAKNEALKLIPLAVCLNGKVEISNVPKILDIYSQIEIFKFLGGETSFNDNLSLDGSNINSSSIVTDCAKSLRASIVYLGPLLSRFKKAQIPFPGGCAIGQRPIDTHLNAFRDLGATIEEGDDVVTVSIDEITADHVELDMKSVSATENLLLFLSSQDADVRVSNCAVEPEIIHLVGILNSAGASIERTDREFHIKGTSKLKIDKIEVMPDRIEAGTFLIAFASTGGTGEIYPFEQSHLVTVIDQLRRCGVVIEVDEKLKRCTVKSRDSYNTFDITTGPYPKFPTDLQSPMALIALRANGVSTIHETMFENRFGYLEKIRKMGLKFELVGNDKAEISGPCELTGANVESLDLRAGITVLLAGVMATGESVIDGAEIIDRGYEGIDKKLSKLGVDIKRSDG